MLTKRGKRATRARGEFPHFPPPPSSLVCSVARLGSQLPLRVGPTATPTPHWIDRGGGTLCRARTGARMYVLCGDLQLVECRRPARANISNPYMESLFGEKVFSSLLDLFSHLEFSLRVAGRGAGSRADVGWVPACEACQRERMAKARPTATASRDAQGGRQPRNGATGYVRSARRARRARRTLRNSIIGSSTHLF